MAENATTFGETLMQKLWNVNEVADFLGVAVGSVYHFVSQKRIPCVRLSARCLRFDSQVIREWVAARAENSEGIGSIPQEVLEKGRKRKKAPLCSERRILT
jgi:predicted DNA-binding transcriptional regulator AlpA